MRKYDAGCQKRKCDKLHQDVVKKTKPITQFLTINKPDYALEKDHADLDNVLARPGTSTEYPHTSKDNEHELLDQTVEPTLPTEADANNNANDIGSIVEKASMTQIDIGLIDKRNSIEIESFLKCQDFEVPTDVSKDNNNISFPVRLFKVTLTNGEHYKRDWLCWSKTKQSLYCAPCFLFIKGIVPQSWIFKRKKHIYFCEI